MRLEVAMTVVASAVNNVLDSEDIDGSSAVTTSDLNIYNDSTHLCREGKPIAAGWYRRGFRICALEED